ncbi:MAG TPA: hypothetical protein VM266_00965 [Solirubrobacteraceae bacterium]|nr:hypothetical protein [Solirubrobacteraceae bacterium]
MAADDAAWARVRAVLEAHPDELEELRVLTATWDAPRRAALLARAAEHAEAGAPPQAVWVLALGDLLP